MLHFSIPASSFPALKLSPISDSVVRRKPPLRAWPTVSSLPSNSSSWKFDSSTPMFPPLNKSVAAIILGDGSHSKLYPLVQRRSEGAIPIAANYRLIDIVVSNCINSDITKIYAITQFNSTSLNSHLSRAYSQNFGFNNNRFVEILTAYQSPEDQDWFKGTGDAIRRYLWLLEEHPVTEYLILPGHHLYRMDYQKLMQAHRSSNADITVTFSCTRTNRDMKNLSAKMEPTQAMDNDAYKTRSMGIYVFKRDALIKVLTEYFRSSNDLGSDEIRGAISKGMKVHSYNFDGYWEDMATIKAFYQANMDCVRKETTGFRFYDKDYEVYTLPTSLPPSSIMGATIVDSVIGDGCFLNKCEIKGSVIGMRTWIGDGAVIEDSVIMGADIYQTDARRSEMEKDGMDIPIGIGKHSFIKKAIIDKNARIGRNVKILNRDNIQEANRESFGYLIREGILVVIQNAKIPDNTIL